MTIDDVASSSSGYKTNVSCHSTWESNVHPYPNPAASAFRAISMTRLAGGLG
jgi:hypothetical protein